MITLQRINKKEVKAIPIPNEDNRPIRGYDICEEVYANIFLCAKKKSGKTSALFKIMKECADRNTVIYIFCSTAYKDKNWIEIRKYFKNKGMDVHVFTSIFEDGTDQLAQLISDLKQDAKEKEEEEEEADPNYDNMLDRLQNMTASYGDEKTFESPKRSRRPKYLAPEFMIIFDDLSSELKSRTLLSLLKFNRHFKSKLIISSQWLHDLLPESRKQIDLFLIFKGFPIQKLQELYKDADTGVPFDVFCEMYKKATEKKHSFLYVDSRADEFRRNFDSKFIIHNKEF